MNKSTLLLGSNLGDKKNNIEKTLNIIDQKIGNILQISDLIESAPEGYNSENNYFNIGIIIQTPLSPFELLKSLKKIEHSLGRYHDSSVSGKYEDRVIDIDIVYFNSLEFYSHKLKIPHFKHICMRYFSKKILHQLN